MSISCLNSSASNPMFLMKLPTPGYLLYPEPTSRPRPSFTLTDNMIFLWSIRRSLNILPRSLCCRRLRLSLARMISAISHRLRTAAVSRILSVQMGRCWRGRRRCKGIWWRATGGSILILILPLLRLRIGWLDVIAFFSFFTSHSCVSFSFCDSLVTSIIHPIPLSHHINHTSYSSVSLSLLFSHHIHHTFLFHLTSTFLTFLFHLTSHSRKRNETTRPRIHSYFHVLFMHRHFPFFICTYRIV